MSLMEEGDEMNVDGDENEKPKVRNPINTVNLLNWFKKHISNIKETKTEKRNDESKKSNRSKCAAI